MVLRSLLDVVEDWRTARELKELKAEVSIPVIGNGDVLCSDDYFKMKEETNCDGVMIGRGALGNPWIFKQINNEIHGKSKDELNIHDIINIARKHFLLLKEDKNDRICVNLAKKHFSFYFKGFDGASAWRKKIMELDNSKDIILVLNEMEEEYSLAI